MKAGYAALLVCSLFPAAAPAQTSPSPSFEDPRIQTVEYKAGSPIRLVAFPDASLSVVFHQGEVIQRVALSDGSAFSASVVGPGDTVELTSLRAGASATMRVATSLRQYEFLVETGKSLTAAYVVRLVDGASESPAVTAPEPGAELREYKLSGDRPLRPQAVTDDGIRTYVDWYPQQALPAVFGVGPTGDEEIVAGYMRGGKYVIERVYPELVFRIDKDHAQAKRRKKKD